MVKSMSMPINTDHRQTMLSVKRSTPEIRRTQAGIANRFESAVYGSSGHGEDVEYYHGENPVAPASQNPAQHQRGASKPFAKMPLSMVSVMQTVA